MFKCVSCFTTTHNLLQHGLRRCRSVYIDRCWLCCKWAVFGFVFLVIREVRCTQVVLYSFFIALCCSHSIVCCSMYLLLLALLLFSLISEYSSRALPVASSSEFFFYRGCLLLLHLKWLLSSSEVVAVPRLRHAALRVVLCFEGGETAGVAEVNDTMLDLWYTSDSCPKTGQWELLSSLDCSMSPGAVWDVAVSAPVRSTMDVASTIKKSGHPCFNCFTTFGSSVKCLCTARCGVVKTFSSFLLGSCWFLFECCWTKHASVVTDPLFNTKLSSVLAGYCLYLLPSCSQALGTNSTGPGGLRSQKPNFKMCSVLHLWRVW